MEMNSSVSLAYFFFSAFHAYQRKYKINSKEMQNTFSGNTKIQFKGNAKHISMEMEIKS